MGTYYNGVKLIDETVFHGLQHPFQTENTKEQRMEKPVVKGPVDSNAFAVMERVGRALKKAGKYDESDEYIKKAMASESYDQLLVISMDYVDFELN